MAGGMLLMLYISLGAKLIAGILPELKAAAAKTPNPADDAAIEVLSAAVEILSGGGIQELIKK